MNKRKLEIELIDQYNEFKVAQYDLFENNTANNKLKVLDARKKGVIIAEKLKENFQTKYPNISFNLN
jgi:pyrimidine operon attenuation protein/uracil phosphoribosyltransferase